MLDLIHEVKAKILVANFWTSVGPSQRLLVSIYFKPTDDWPIFFTSRPLNDYSIWYCLRSKGLGPSWPSGPAENFEKLNYIRDFHEGLTAHLLLGLPMHLLKYFISSHLHILPKHVENSSPVAHFLGCGLILCRNFHPWQRYMNLIWFLLVEVNEDCMDF